jgi:hypothetical protein
MWTSPGRPLLAYGVDGRNDIRMSPGCASEFVVDVVMGTGRATSEFVVDAVNNALGGAVDDISDGAVNDPCPGPGRASSTFIVDEYSTAPRT